MPDDEEVREWPSSFLEWFVSNDTTTGVRELYIDRLQNSYRKLQAPRSTSVAPVATGRPIEELMSSAEAAAWQERLKQLRGEDE